MEKPSHLYVGRRQSLLNEIGEHLDIYNGKYLVYPVDQVGAGTFDAEGAESQKTVAFLIREYRRMYPGIIVYRI